MLELIAELADGPRLDGGVLDVPFDDYAAGCASPTVAELLRAYARMHRQPTLRLILRDARFRRWAEAAARTKLRTELESELMILKGVVETEENILDPVSLAPADAARGTGAGGALLGWAESAGVAARMREPASVLAPDVPAGQMRRFVSELRRITVGDLLQGKVDGYVGITAAERKALASCAQAYVHAAVERALSDEEDARRVAELGHVPDGEGVQEFIAALDTELAGSERPPPAARITFGDWSLRAEPARLIATGHVPVTGSGRPRVVTTSITLEDWRAAPLLSSVQSDKKDGRTADATRAFLGGVRRVLGDPAHPAYASLVGFLNEPAWSRVLAKTATAFPRLVDGPGDPEDLGIEWRIMKERTIRIAPVVRPSIHREVLQEISLDGVAHGSVRSATALDELVAQALFVATSIPNYRYWTVGANGLAGLPEDQQTERTFRAIALLAGHPTVVGRDGQPLAVVTGDIAAELDGTDETGYRFGFAVGGARIASVVLRDGIDARGYLLHLDPARRLVVAAHVGARRGQILRALASEAATFPSSARGPLVERVVALSDVVPIALPPSLIGENIAADPRPLVRVVRTAPDELSLSWLVRPVRGGPAFPTAEGRPQLLEEIAGRTVVATRSFDDERQRAEALKARLPASVLNRGGARCEGMREVLPVIELLRAAAAADEATIEWPKSLPRVVGQAAWSKLHLRVTQQRDWFGVDGALEIDGEAITLQDLLAARRSGEPFVVIGADRLVALEGELRARLDDLEALGRTGADGGLALSSAAVPALAQLVEDKDRLDAAPSFWKLLARIEEAAVSDPKLPRGFAKVLRPYQVEGFRWMMRLAAWGGGACLADEMGLGKTVQTLALLAARSKEGPALVVAPTSVGPNWMAEAKRFAPSLNPILHRGADRDATLAKIGPGTLLVTSYDVLARDIDELPKHPFATIVLDEAQAIKNGQTARARAARALRGDFRLALTGTPVENRLAEVYSLMEFLNPGFFGSEAQFRERWVIPIERDQDATRSAALARLLRPFVLRRLKADVLTELPARTEVLQTVERSVPERKLYEAARQLALAALAGAEEDARFRVLAELMRLRRLACHPRLDDPTSKVESSKLAAFLEIVDDLRAGGHRALVFSQFTGHLALVEEALKARQISYLYLDGKTPLADRTKRVQAFQEGDAPLFLISLKAGGTGLNLTAADTVIHLDPWWNPAVEDQASDRAHRIGQLRPVTVIRLIAQGTIEESVVALHAEKRKLAESILEGSAASGKLSIAELGALIRNGDAVDP